MSDYIKRADAIETICRYRCDALPCTINPCGNVDEMLQIPGVPEPPQWVSCKDMLPPVGVPVLVYSKWRHINDRTLAADGFFRPDGLKPVKDITHWMPLPEPPEAPE